jgi:hypothetical protein
LGGAAEYVPSTGCCSSLVVAALIATGKARSSRQISLGKSSILFARSGHHLDYPEGGHPWVDCGRQGGHRLGEDDRCGARIRPAIFPCATRMSRRRCSFKGAQHETDEVSGHRQTLCKIGEENCLRRSCSARAIRRSTRQMRRARPSRPVFTIGWSSGQAEKMISSRAPDATRARLPSPKFSD